MVIEITATCMHLQYGSSIHELRQCFLELLHDRHENWRNHWGAQMWVIEEDTKREEKRFRPPIEASWAVIHACSTITSTYLTAASASQELHWGPESWTQLTKMSEDIEYLLRVARWRFGVTKGIVGLSLHTKEGSNLYQKYTDQVYLAANPSPEGFKHFTSINYVTDIVNNDSQFITILAHLVSELLQFSPAGIDGGDTATEGHDETGPFVSNMAYFAISFPDLVPLDKGVLRIVARHCSSVLDLGANIGHASRFLTEHGVKKVHAVDGTHNIKNITKGFVDHADIALKCCCKLVQVKKASTIF